MGAQRGVVVCVLRGRNSFVAIGASGSLDLCFATFLTLASQIIDLSEGLGRGLGLDGAAQTFQV